MTYPIEIKERHATLSAAASALIRKRASRLSHFYEQIRKCRVTVEGPGPHHRKGT